MSSNSSTSYFYSEFDKHIPIFRIIFLYGCYSQKGIEEKTGKRDKTYTAAIGSLKQYFLLPDEITGLEYGSFHKEIERRKGIYRAKYNRYKDRNFLYIFYRLRKSEPSDLYNYYYFISGENVNISDNRKGRELRIYFGASSKDDGEKREDLNRFLTGEERKELSSALLFFIEKAPYSVPGYFLYRKLNDEIKSNFIFKYANIYRVFDERYIYKIFYAIKNGYNVEFTYRNGNKDIRKTVIPLKIKHEYYCGRTYFLARTYNDNGYTALRTFRLDKIKDISFTERVFVPSGKNNTNMSCLLLASNNKDKLYKVKVKFQNIKFSRMKQIVAAISPANIDEKTMSWEITMSQYRDIVPFLRRYAAIEQRGQQTAYVPCAQIDKDTSPELYQFLLKDFKKALSNYEKDE